MTTVDAGLGTRVLELAPQVSIRREPFGALLYHYPARQLVLLKETGLADLLLQFGRPSTFDAACDAVGVGERNRRRYWGAMSSFRQLGIVRDRTPWVTSGEPNRRPAPVVQTPPQEARQSRRLPRHGDSPLARGTRSPICLTWELTYACNLACAHCLSSSGRRDPAELSTIEARALIDEMERMQVFYVNVGGGEPTVRSDFWELLDYATAHRVGVKFSTNGSRITAAAAWRIAQNDYIDVQISLDGATSEVNDTLRGEGTFAMATKAMDNLASAGVHGFKVSVVMTKYNVEQLDQLKQIADRYGAQLEVNPFTTIRPGSRRVGAVAPDCRAAEVAPLLACRSR